MRIIRAPLRISMFGGGTDLPDYLANHDITIISFAITRYMYVVWNPRPTGGCRLSYSRVEELGTFSYAEHTLVRAVATEYNLPEPGTLTIISDIPKGTGLGSSSSLMVGLCKLAGACEKSNLNIATTAFQLENQVSPEVGCQDHLPAAFGGMKIYNVSREGVVRYKPVPNAAEAIINQYGLLLYTGESRDSSTVLKKWKDEATLDGIRELAEEQARRIEMWTPQFLGSILDETWQLKRSIPGVVNVELDRQYNVAIQSGAYGGKLCFPSGTLVCAGIGDYKDIEDVEIGDWILNHQNCRTQVRTLHQHQYCGDLVRLKVKGLSRSVLATLEHPFLMTRKHPSNKRLSTGKIVNLPFFKEAQEIRKGDCLLIPVDDGAVNLEYIDTEWFVDYVQPSASRVNAWQNIPDRIQLGFDFLSLIGWYAAEGSNSHNQLSFDLHRKEVNEAKEISDAFLHLFEKMPTIRKTSKNGVRLVVSSVVLSNLFQSMCGKGAKNKRFPPFCEYLDVSKQAILLRAVWRGDGCCVSKFDKRTGKEYAVCAYKTVSFRLAKQVQHMCHRLGYVTSIKRTVLWSGSDCWTISIHGDDADAFSEYICTGVLVGVKRKNAKSLSLRKDIVEIEGYRYVKRSVVKKDTEFYDGIVYNISVDYPHTYIANDVAVHNCGAGGGGCWFFITNDKDRVKKALGLQEIPFKVEQEGVKEWEL